jgi:hypothetical protein
LNIELFKKQGFGSHFHFKTNYKMPKGNVKW